MVAKKQKKLESHRDIRSFAETYPEEHKRALEVINAGMSPLLKPGEKPPTIGKLTHWIEPDLHSAEEAKRMDIITNIGERVFGYALAKELIEFGRHQEKTKWHPSFENQTDCAKEISFPFLRDDISFEKVKSIFLNELSKAIEATAEFISADQEVRKDFTEKAMRFAEGYVYDLNEANPPPVPEIKFTPRQDDIICFLRDVWGEWNERDLLNRQVLGDHDPKALTALVNWFNQDIEPKNKLPDDLKVYTKKEMTERWLAKFYFAKDEVRRAASAMNNRRHRTL